MRHKGGTLTNLELALFNAVALHAVMVNSSMSDPCGVGGVTVYSHQIARLAGYKKLSTNHYRALEKLCNWGYLTSWWETSRTKAWAVAKGGSDWLGGTRIEGEIKVTTQMNDAYNQMEIPF